MEEEVPFFEGRRLHRRVPLPATEATEGHVLTCGAEKLHGQHSCSALHRHFITDVVGGETIAKAGGGGGGGGGEKWSKTMEFTGKFMPTKK